MKSKEEIIRIPRPTGITYLCTQLNNANKNNLINDSKELSERIRTVIIKQYLSTGFKVNNKPFDIQQLSEYIGIDIVTLMNEIVRVGSQIGNLVSGNQAIKTWEMVVSLSLSGSLENKARILNQYSLLAKSQGDGFKAFISGEVNKSLDLLLKADKGLLEVARAIRPTGLGLNAQLEPEIPTTDYITIDKAVEMLGDTNKALGPISLEEVNEIGYLDGAPNINATITELDGVGAKKVKAIKTNLKKTAHGRPEIEDIIME